MEVMGSAGTTSKGMRWTGRVIFGLVVLTMALDAFMKIIRSKPSMEGTIALGWPADKVQAIGMILMVCTILYVVPRTASLGAILLTGYLGGAIAVMMRHGTPFWFPVMMGVLTWVGLWWRNEKVRELMAFGQKAHP